MSAHVSHVYGSVVNTLRWAAVSGLVHKSKCKNQQPGLRILMYAHCTRIEAARRTARVLQIPAAFRASYFHGMCTRNYGFFGSAKCTRAACTVYRVRRMRAWFTERTCGACSCQHNLCVCVFVRVLCLVPFTDATVYMLLIARANH